MLKYFEEGLTHAVIIGTVNIIYLPGFGAYIILSFLIYDATLMQFTVHGKDVSWLHSNWEY